MKLCAEILNGLFNRNVFVKVAKNRIFQWVLRLIRFLDLPIAT